jgi:X-Pro dipeptidyl-peptidase
MGVRRRVPGNGRPDRTVGAASPDTRRTFRGAARGLIALVGAGVAPAAGQGPDAARPVFRDGQAQVVPAFADSSTWIREELWVEAEFDSDGDGERDRVHVAVVRPAQTETEDLDVPVVYASSPYYAGTSGDRQYLWDVRQEVGGDPPPRTPRSTTGYPGASPSSTPRRRAPACPKAAPP